MFAHAKPALKNVFSHAQPEVTIKTFYACWVCVKNLLHMLSMRWKNYDPCWAWANKMPTYFEHVVKSYNFEFWKQIRNIQK
jgi:ABC-type anion transport system duplicated permease subunit